MTTPQESKPLPAPEDNVKSLEEAKTEEIKKSDKVFVWGTWIPVEKPDSDL